MQLKTIQKIISSKMTAWLETIPDEGLRLAVKNNLLVSGGSIVSLLTGQPVNDYDVYIKDMDVLLSVTTFYAKQDHLTVLDGRKKNNYLDDLEAKYHGLEISEIDNKYATQLRNLQPDQIKILIYGGGTSFNEGKKEEDELKYYPKFFSPNAISLSGNVQLVCRFHGNAEAIHKTFDFIHATNYFTFENGLVTNKAALESIITKQLKYQGSLNPLT